MPNERLRFDGYSIVMQEVPGEISLALSITECPHHCEGCHSSYLAEARGDFVGNHLLSLLLDYESFVTCVCFMGGDQHIDDLREQCQSVRNFFPNMKLAIYTGADTMDALGDTVGLFDYIKIGHYDDVLGGLDRPTTNQKMFHRNAEGTLENITSTFWRRHT